MSRGRGRGRGGKPSVFTAQLLGHIPFNEIIEKSKEEAKEAELYPEIKLPQTEDPTSREARVAKRYNENVAALQQKPGRIRLPEQSGSADIERWSDKLQKSKNGTYRPDFVREMRSRGYDSELMPKVGYESVLGKRSKGGSGPKDKDGKKATDQLDKFENDNDDEQSDALEDDLDEEDAADYDEDDGDNDYEAEYFDPGEDDMGDGLGDGGRGEDEDGGVY